MAASTKLLTKNFKTMDSFRLKFQEITQQVVVWFEVSEARESNTKDEDEGITKILEDSNWRWIEKTSACERVQVPGQGGWPSERSLLAGSFNFPITDSIVFLDTQMVWLSSERVCYSYASWSCDSNHSCFLRGSPWINTGCFLAWVNL